MGDYVFGKYVQSAGDGMSKIINNLIMLKAMAKLNGKECLKEVPAMRNPRKKRKKETEPRKQPEREFRNKAIKWLRSNNCIVYRIENSIQYNVGIPDLLVFAQQQWWVELKSPIGNLSAEQYEFRQRCLRVGINHLVARDIEDLKIICNIPSL